MALIFRKYSNFHIGAEIDYRSLVGFLSEDILESLFGDEWGEMKFSPIAYRRCGQLA